MRQSSRTPTHKGALPSADLARLLPHLDPIQLGLGDVLYESGALQKFVYFPTTSIISLLYVMADEAVGHFIDLTPGLPVAARIYFLDLQDQRLPIPRSK